MRYRMSRHDAVDDLTVALAAARGLGGPESRDRDHPGGGDRVRLDGRVPPVARAGTEAAALLAKLDGRNDFLRASLLVGQGRALWRFPGADRRSRSSVRRIAMAEPLGDQAYEIRVISSAAARRSAPLPGQGGGGGAGLRDGDGAARGARRPGAPDGRVPQPAPALARAARTSIARSRTPGAASRSRARSASSSRILQGRVQPRRAPVSGGRCRRGLAARPARGGDGSEAPVALQAARRAPAGGAAPRLPRARSRRRASWSTR